MNILHYSTSYDPNPLCEKCGARINPGLDKEPYTRTLSLWNFPPSGYQNCMENKDVSNTAGQDDSSTPATLADSDEGTK